MFNSGSWIRAGRMPVLALVLVATILSGCKSKMDQALDQARKQAAATGQAQQVVSVDKNGITTTTMVQPPAPGQATGAISTTTTPPEAGAPVPAASGPTVSAVPPPAPEPIPPPEPVAPASLSIPAGTTLTIRIDGGINVKTSNAGDKFAGEIADPVVAADNSVLVPKGAPVRGVVDVAHRRGHFKGESLLQLRLTSITLNGTRYALATRDVVRGGAGPDAKDRDLAIPAESHLRFKLAKDVVLQPAQ